MNQNETSNAGWTTGPANGPDYRNMPIEQLLKLDPHALQGDAKIIVRDRLLQHWDITKKTLAHAKEVEMSYRVACVAILADPSQTKGTQNVELGNDYKAKMVLKESKSFIKGDDGKIDKRAIDRALSRIEQSGENGPLIAERLVKWTPDISETEYKLLPANLKAIIDKVLVTKAGAPTLEIVEPKAKK